MPANGSWILLTLLGGILGADVGKAQPIAASPTADRPVLSSSLPTNARWTAPSALPPVSTLPVASTPPPTLPLQQVRYQPPANSDQPDGITPQFQIQLEPPGLERLSRLDSDVRWQERIRQESNVISPDEKITFPEEPVLSRDRYQGRGNLWQRRKMLVEPNYVNYGYLYFEDLNQERYGWDLGPLSPVVGVAHFFKNYVLFPMHFATHGFSYDTGAGYCLPGDPVPLLLYPPEITLRATAAEIATILVLVAIFP